MAMPTYQEIENGIEDQLQDAILPEFVGWTQVEIGTDAAGETAAWVWLIVTETYTGSSGQRQQLEAAREEIQAAAGRVMPGLWAYVRLREPDDLLTHS